MRRVPRHAHSNPILAYAETGPAADVALSALLWAQRQHPRREARPEGLRWLAPQGAQLDHVLLSTQGTQPMGVMISGEYHIDDPAPDSGLDGTFKRARSSLRDWIARDTQSVPPGARQFPAEAGHYHLYVAWNCPWAHRSLLVRALKGLNQIALSYARPRRTEMGWVFDPDGPFADPLLGVANLPQIYARQDPPYMAHPAMRRSQERAQPPNVADRVNDCIGGLRNDYGCTLFLYD